MVKKGNFNSKLKSSIKKINRDQIDRLEVISSELNSQKQILENIQKKLVHTTPKWKLIFKYIMLFFLNIILVIPFTINVEELITTKNNPVSYKISNYSAKPATEAHIRLEEGKDFEFKHSIDINIHYKIYSGQIKKLYAVYSYDDSDEFDESSFHKLPIETSENNFHKLLFLLPTYTTLANKISILPHDLSLSSGSFNTKINFGSYDSTTVKNIYLLNVDPQNNLSIDLLLVTNTSTMQQYDTNEKHKTAKFHGYASGQKTFLQKISSNELLNGSYSSEEQKRFKKNTEKILAIYNIYSPINES
ncbi:hypothetical protein SFC81_01505 [Enterococcus faecalis]